MEKIFHIEEVANVKYESSDISVMSNYELLEGLRCWDNNTLNYIYQNFYSGVEAYVIKSKGTTEDMEDLFHDALITLNKKLNRQQLDLKKDFYYYFFGMCRRIWLNRLKEKINEVSYDDCACLQELEVARGNDSFIYASDYVEKEKLLKHHINKLDQDSQKIIELHLNNVPYKKIAEIMNLESEQHARNKKHYCKELLMKNIYCDRRFNELIEK